MLLLRTLMLSTLCAASAAAQSPAQPPPDPAVIVTTGEGVVKKAPDRVWVSIAAESRARTAREAQRANAEAMTAVTGKLKASGLGENAVRTTAYDLQPEYDYANGKQTLRGYVARNVIEVRVDDVARVGEILELAVGSGATSVSGLRFDLRDRGGAEREALRLAVVEARQRAESIAAGANVRIERVLRIEEQRGISEPRPLMMARQEMSAQAKADVPVTPGEIEIRGNVTLTVVIR